MYADSNSWTNDRSLFEKYVVSFGFAYDFAFCRNKWSLKIFQNVLWKKSFNNANRYQSFFGGDSPNNIKKT